MSRVRLSLLALCALCACAAESKPKDYGDPTALSTPTVESSITAWVESPLLREKLATATPDIVIGAYSLDDEKKPEQLLVSLGRVEKDGSGYDQVEDLLPAVAEGEPGPKQRFRFPMPLVHGQNRILVRIETLDHARVRRMSFALSYEGDAPGVTLSVGIPSAAALKSGKVCSETSPLTQAVTNARIVCVRGSVSTLHKQAVELSLGLSGGDHTSVALDANGHFESPLMLPANQEHVIEAEATDAKARKTTAQLSLVQDEEPPTLKVTSHSTQTTEQSIDITGTASDPYGVAAVEIQNASGSLQTLSGASPWRTNLQLGVGENDVDVVARDLAGNEARSKLKLYRLRELWLDEPRKSAGATNIEVNKFDLNELLTADDQKTLIMAEIDLEPAVKHALERIREPEKYGVDTSGWGDPERNMQRILDMTPDTADLSGTSMAELLTIADAIGLPAPRMLSDLLDIGVTEPFLDPDVATAVIMDLLVGTHPNVQKDAQGHFVIDVSMYDVFQDMTTLAMRFGPVGAHPGFLEGQSYAQVLEPGFLMTLPVNSNLVQYDAVDLERGAKDFLFILHGDRVLDFDVNTAQFTVVGLKDEPTIDLRFGLEEYDGKLVAGTSQTANPDANDAGFYRGNGGGWGVDGWLFEHIAVEAGYRMFHESYASDNYARVLHYDAGSIHDAAVVSWNKGWVTIDTAGGIGDPPQPLYAWDLLMEVAQVRLHDHGLAEGQANMAFALEDLSIGLTADQLIEKLRPKLAEQQTKLSELFVGDLGLASTKADVFYAPANGQEGALLFRAKGDGAGDYTYPHVGFYADAKLTKKVSTTAAAGGVSDEKHEKVAATLGHSFYAANEVGDVYEIEIAAREGTKIGLHVYPVETVQ
jgi:hypothetical protein